MQKYDVDSQKFVVLPKEPIGLLFNKVKFLIVFDSDGCYTPKRVDCLNNICDYLSMPRYRKLLTLFNDAKYFGAEVFLFDSWQEFYLWCTE